MGGSFPIFSFQPKRHDVMLFEAVTDHFLTSGGMALCEVVVYYVCRPEKAMVSWVLKLPDDGVSKGGQLLQAGRQLACARCYQG
jgi:hypothetical protein